MGGGGVIRMSLEGERVMFSLDIAWKQSLRISAVLDEFPPPSTVCFSSLQVE